MRTVVKFVKHGLHVNNLGVGNGSGFSEDYQGFKVMIDKARKKETIVAPPCISRDIFAHIKDFVGNKIRLGKVVDTATGADQAIPIYSPRDGIFNMQYTLNDIQSANIDLSGFIIKCLQDVSNFNRWLLITKKSFLGDQHEKV